MRIVIMGCDRVGATIAQAMVGEGNTVTVMDTNEENLRRMPLSLGITLLLGDGTLDADLQRAGIDKADAFVAVDETDARNALAAQKARALFKTPKVVCCIADPDRLDMYRALGLEAVSSTMAASTMILDAVRR